MATFFFKAAFGDQAIRITRIDTDDGRDIAVQSPARGSRHFLQDRGAKLGRASCEIVFVDEPNAPDFLERFELFRALIATGEAQIFSHPLIGPYRARAEGGQHRADNRARTVTYECAFLPEDEPQPVTTEGLGTSPVAGLQAVGVAASEADDELESIGVESAAPAACLETVTAWTEAEDLDSQEVLVAVDSLTAQINDSIDELELATNLASWPAYRSMINLTQAVRRAADALTDSGGHATTIHVSAATPLMAICSEVYGPDLAIEMAEKVARSNRLRTPGLVPAGTTLSMLPVRQS